MYLGCKDMDLSRDTMREGSVEMTLQKTEGVLKRATRAISVWQIT